MARGLVLARLRALVLPATLLAACMLVVVLGMQVRSLRSDLHVQRQRAVLPAAGQLVPPVRARTLAGDSILVGEGTPGSRQVLFVFNTTCPMCVETLANWTRIAARLAAAPQVSVLGWSQDLDSATVAYLAAHGLSFRTVVGVPKKYLALYRVLGVPATLVVDEDGDVLYGRPGALTTAAEDSVVRAALEGQ